MQSALKGGDAKEIAGSALASGSGLPLGSVGVSLKKIIATGAVNQVGRGTYQIGATTATAAVLASEPVVKIVSGKKVKAAKKVKAEAPAAKELNAKAAPAKKAKAPIAKKAKYAHPLEKVKRADLRARRGTKVSNLDVTTDSGQLFRYREPRRNCC